MEVGIAIIVVLALYAIYKIYKTNKMKKHAEITKQHFSEKPVEQIDTYADTTARVKAAIEKSKAAREANQINTNSRQTEHHGPKQYQPKRSYSSSPTNNTTNSHTNYDYGDSYSSGGGGGSSSCSGGGGGSDSGSSSAGSSCD